MTERPILFSAPMVRALLAGTKSQTRRPMKPQPPPHLEGKPIRWLYENLWGAMSVVNEAACCRGEDTIRCPYGAPGDRLWVRETFAQTAAPSVVYRADNRINQPYWSLLKWKPSIYMPRSLSRLTLEVTDVRVQRVQEISEEDARAEGVKPMVAGTDGEGPIKTYRTGFVYVWNSLHAKDGCGWDANPWAWAITFKVVKGGGR